MKRIICVGNRYVAVDAAGPRVYDALITRDLPDDVQLIDGGLAGLDLLRFVDGAERVVFVDGLVGFSRPQEIVVLEAAEVAASGAVRHDHSAGLGYLFRVLPWVCDGVPPDVLLVGIEGQPDDALVDEAATLTLKAAVKGSAGLR